MSRAAPRRPRPLTLERLEDRCQASYLVTDLGTLGGPFSVAFAINNAGQVAGQAYLADGHWHGFLYTDGQMADLGALAPGANSTATAINDAGQVAGRGFTDSQSTAWHAFLYSDGVLTDLGTLGGRDSDAFGINNSGQVVGESQLAGDSPIRAFRYSAGHMADMGTLAQGVYSSASAVNDSGVAVGTADPYPGASVHAATFDAYGVRDLGTLGGTTSFAYGIKRCGDVVGGAATSGSSPIHAFLYSHTMMTDLGAFPGSTYATATAINDQRVAVGWGFLDPAGAELRAFVSDGGTLTDLNDLVPPDSGWVLRKALGINNAGQIVGYGEHDGVDTRGFLLTPDGGTLAAAGLAGRVPVAAPVMLPGEATSTGLLRIVIPTLAADFTGEGASLGSARGRGASPAPRCVDEHDGGGLGSDWPGETTLAPPL